MIDTVFGRKNHDSIIANMIERELKLFDARIDNQTKLNCLITLMLVVKIKNKGQMGLGPL
jgi:hypothetical protein